MKRLIALVVVAAGALTLRAAAWRGLTEAGYYSGPKLTEDDLDGKVVLVDCWGVNCPPCRALLPRMEQIWQGFKSKPFVLLGSHCQGRAPEKVAELVKANKLTYPIYDFAGLAQGEPPSGGGLPFMYVVNHRGKVVYAGRDERAATEAVVNALGAAGGAISFTGGVELKKYKALEKQLVLGKPMKSVVKKLEADAKKGDAKAASAAAKAQAEEAAAILRAIAEAKEDVRHDIDRAKTRDPAKALKLVKDFSASFPDEAVDYKAEIPELTARAKEAAAAQKAAAKAKK